MDHELQGLVDVWFTAVEVETGKIIPVELPHKAGAISFYAS